MATDKGLNEVDFVDDVAAIDAALDACRLDVSTRDAWREEMLGMARSGWFCPTCEDEMKEALAALRVGQPVPCFPRTG